MKVFATAKPVHFPGLPGRPRHDRAGGRARLLDVVGRDLEVLQDAGVGGVLFCNEADIPYQPPTSTWPPRAACGSARPAAWPSKTPPTGVLAAKDAGMTCVAVPDPLLTGDPRYRRADLILPSLTELDGPTLRSLTQ